MTKNSKIQNGRHFWKDVKFLRIEPSILHVYPAGQKFRRNRSISHSLGDTSNFKFYHFCQKFKMAAIFGEEMFLELSRVLSRDTCGSKISSIYVLEVIKEFVFSSLIKILMLN